MNRAGGLVSWPWGSSADADSCWPTVSAGSRRSSSSSARLVATRLVREQEAGERDHGAGGAEERVGAIGAGRPQLDRHGLPDGVLHLRGDRALEDEVVERMFVARELARELGGRAEDVAGRADRLVGLLRVRDRTLVPSRLRRHRVRPIHPRRMRPRRHKRVFGERYGVGAHVRDVPVLVEPLREAHRRLGGEAELAARLLLQRRGPERRRRPSGVGLLLDRAHLERTAGQAFGECSRPIFGQDEQAWRPRRAVLAEVATLRDRAIRRVRRDAPRTRPGSNEPTRSQ